MYSTQYLELRSTFPSTNREVRDDKPILYFSTPQADMEVPLSDIAIELHK